MEILTSANTSALLDKYNLTALVPVLALFLISVIAYSINRVVDGIAGLLPFNLTTSPGSIIESRIRSDSQWRRHLARHNSSSAHILIEYMIAKARYEKQEGLLSNVDSWIRNSGKAAQLFFFSKFLLVWTVACAALSVTLPDATHFTYKRLALMLLLVISFGLFSACRHAAAARQVVYSQLSTVRVLLDSEVAGEPEPKTEPIESSISPDQSQPRDVWNNPREPPWWRIRLGLTESWAMLGYYEYLAVAYPSNDRNLWLQGVVKNSLNILWFITGAFIIWLLSKLSWWVGCFLFVGYVSVTIIDCLTIGVLLAGTFGRAVLARLKTRLPSELIELLPQGLFERFKIAEREEYWLVAAGTRGVEAIIAIILSKALANYFF